MSLSPTCLKVDLSATVSDASYDILIGDGLLAETGDLLAARLGVRRCLVVTDGNVAPLYLARLEAALQKAGHTLLPAAVVSPSERTKNYAGLLQLLGLLLAAGVDRKTVIIALGGGVIGDLAGFAASIVLRGVDFVQVPTTLLAQVDSSVGGKNGIDTPYGKNTVGTFYQPRLVVADVALLDSLPIREVRSGYAEVVKYGLINDAAFFAWCEDHGAKLLKGDRAAQREAVRVSCANKAKIVVADEREAGQRALLNLGHTFGHALEAMTGYSDALKHGEAVAIGMALAFDFSAQNGLCAVAEAEKVSRHLHAIGLPTSPAPYVQDVDGVMERMAQDKKADNGKMTLILARGIGQSYVERNVDESAVRALWQRFT